MSLVVITEVGDLDPRPGIALLEEAGCEVVVLWDGLDSPLPPGADRAAAAIVGFAAFGSIQLDLFPSLRLVCTTSTGVDMVDVAAAGARGVEVVGLGGVSSQEVALHAFALILAALRELPAGRRVVTAGGWTADLDVVPRAADDLVLGLIGYGRIGRELARLARPLFARIIAVDPIVTASADGVELTGIDDVLSQSDVISLHLPATASTRGIIDADALSRMRPGALLVNVSRGELVDSAAVRGALDRGELSGYVADVLDAEPPAVDDPLRTHPRAIVTPHMGFLSTASLERYELDPARTIIEWLARVTPDRADSAGSSVSP